MHGGRKANPEFSSPGWSCPIVWRDRVFITTADWPAGLTRRSGKKIIAEHHVLCFQASDGKQLWDTVVPAGKCLVDNFYHGYAVPTPVTDGKHVFALFGSAVLAALDFDGKIVWREELPHAPRCRWRRLQQPHPVRGHRHPARASRTPACAPWTRRPAR